MKYEILEHPAELRIRVFGKTLEELFSNAALAMSDILVKERNVSQPQKKSVKISSIDLNSLLVDFLNDILAKNQTNKVICDVDFIEIHPEFLVDYSRDNIPAAKQPVIKAQINADLLCYPIDHFDEDIKAVTYEDLDIKKVDGIWQTMIVFDI